MSHTIIHAGTRNSPLAVIQTRNALDALEQLVPGIVWKDIHFSSPGDKDQATDLRESPADFFTGRAAL